MKIIPSIFIILILLPSLTSADSTFFDNENDAFVMGRASTPSLITSNARGFICQQGYNYVHGECVRIRIIKTAGETNESSVNISQMNITLSEDKTEVQKREEPKKVEEQLLIADKTTNSPAKKRNELFFYIVAVIGIILILGGYILLFLKKKKQ